MERGENFSFSCPSWDRRLGRTVEFTRIFLEKQKKLFLKGAFGGKCGINFDNSVEIFPCFHSNLCKTVLLILNVFDQVFDPSFEG